MNVVFEMLELQRDFFSWRQTVGYVKVNILYLCGREGVEGTSESLVFSSFTNVLGNPASDYTAEGRLFSAVLFILLSEWAGADAQFSLLWSLTPLCWSKSQGIVWEQPWLSFHSQAQ